MTVKNTGSTEMQFTTALHTYLAISDIGDPSAAPTVNPKTLVFAPRSLTSVTTAV
jgi:hypothetical protein